MQAPFSARYLFFYLIILLFPAQGPKPLSASFRFSFPSANNLIVEPIFPIHIGENITSAGIQLGKTHGNGCEFGPSDLPLRLKAAISHTIENAQRRQNMDGLSVPLSFIHIGKGSCDGNILLQQQIIGAVRQLRIA